MMMIMMDDKTRIEFDYILIMYTAIGNSCYRNKLINSTEWIGPCSNNYQHDECTPVTGTSTGNGYAMIGDGEGGPLLLLCLVLIVAEHE